LSTLEEEKMLLRIRKPVNANYEVAALIKQASVLGKAIVFDHVIGKDHAVAANVAGSPDMISLGLGIDDERKNFLPEFSNRIQKSKDLKSKSVKHGAILEVSEEPSALSKLPVLKYFERDASGYITAGVVIARDPETGYRNCSFNRMMLRRDENLGIRMMPPQHLGLIQGKTESKKRNLEVAVVIGNHPAEMIASASPLPFGEDHLNFASAVRGEPLEVVKCLTNELEVPAHAEVVIEGEIEAGVREAEGPFGEFMDYYVEENKNHVLKVNSISHRADYIFQGLLCGSAEDLSILAAARELAVFNALKQEGFDVVDVSLMPFIFNGIISLKKRSDDEPRRALMRAFNTYSWLKYCIVVDDDVDARNLKDVWWALATRSQASSAVLSIPDMPGFPRRDKWQIHMGKVGIDATVPVDRRKEFERKKIPGEDHIQLADYLWEASSLSQ
jgi:2,5-furandicarboxylate decarboxylase 1